jgi:hypothetical protein
MKHAHATDEHIKERHFKGNHVCFVKKNKIYGPFFVVEKTTNGIVYLDRLWNWSVPQLGRLQRNTNFSIK